MFNFLKKKQQVTFSSDAFAAQQMVVLGTTPVNSFRSMTEQTRRLYSAELLDTYCGYGSGYVARALKDQMNKPEIAAEMMKLTICLPLLKYFFDTISRVYSVQPTRRFYLGGKEIVCDQPDGDVSNPEKYLVNKNYYDALMSLYNTQVCSAIQQAEEYTNLFNTTVYKVVVNRENQINLRYIRNDSCQSFSSPEDITYADVIAYVKNDVLLNQTSYPQNLTPIVEKWTKDDWIVTSTATAIGGTKEPNMVAIESELLFGTKYIGPAFAPFAVFRDSANPLDFWNVKNNDVIRCIRTINVYLSQLAYLVKFCSFGLKYAVGLEWPKDGVIDPIGFLQFGMPRISANTVPGRDTNKNWEVGEFDNNGKIDQVIQSIVFNLKLLYGMFDIPLDSLVTTSSVRSAESKQLDESRLKDAINRQRQIWHTNEQILFKVLQSVYNRDFTPKLPAGIELVVAFDEQEDIEKTTDDWLALVQSNVVSVLDWISDLNPDLDRDELRALFERNISDNALDTNVGLSNSQPKDPVLDKTVNKDQSEI